MKTQNVNELLEKAATDLLRGKYAIALTGAGMSTESGIPDFRGPSGIWTKNPDAEKAAYRSYQAFVQDPRRWWVERLSATSSLIAGWEEARPNAGHYALAELENMGVLKALVTQNVDGLHEKAGTANLLEYHGSILKLRCMKCGTRYWREEYDLADLMARNRLPPLCRSCGGVVKTDGVAFGEPIPSDVAHKSLEEAWKCDVMLICGTSAVVYPFAGLPRIARQKKVEEERQTPGGLHVVEKVPAITIIEINMEPTPLTAEGVSDYIVQGKTGEILPRLVEEVKKRRR